MKLSENFFYTLREDLKDEESVSGNLLVKSGMFKKIGNGIYMKMPLGQKVAENVKAVIRKHMNTAGALELKMPMILPIDVFEKSGRYELFGSSIFKLKDRYNRPYVLGPTHEEFFAIAAMMKANSYKDFPYTLYQIGNKYRDEIRPRLGLIRTREFTMKDAYSFDIGGEQSDISYQKQFEAYHKIFTEVGLEYVVVTADTGVMGGLLSEEFQAISDVGEDILVLCDTCEYASNIEVAPLITQKQEDTEEKLAYKEVYTPDCKTIEDVCNFLKLDIKKSVKALMFNVDGNLCLCFVPGEREVNTTKLGKLLNAKEIEMATEEEIVSNSNSVPGFTGPIGLLVNSGVKIIIDEEVFKIRNSCVGANKKDYHYINANIEDFKYDYRGDICQVKENDVCPKCGNKLYFKKGIEVGNTFKLGTKYSESLGLKFLDEKNELQPVVMGCYGIGVERIVAAIVEQNHDEKGIIWPMNIAPYKVGIVLISNKDEKQKEAAEGLYTNLSEIGIDVILDDREERPGVKFNDMDLIGIPIRIVVGKKVEENKIELKLRHAEEIELVDIPDVIEKVKEIIKY